MAITAFVLANIFFDVRLLVPIDPASSEANRVAMLIVMTGAVVATLVGLIRQVIRDEAARVAAFGD